MKAMYPGYCARCDDPISKGEEVAWRPYANDYIHARCASGQDDE